jgi:hypothetical protein
MFGQGHKTQTVHLQLTTIYSQFPHVTTQSHRMNRFNSHLPTHHLTVPTQNRQTVRVVTYTSVLKVLTTHSEVGQPPSPRIAAATTTITITTTTFNKKWLAQTFFRTQKSKTTEFPIPSGRLSSKTAVSESDNPTGKNKTCQNTTSPQAVSPCGERVEILPKSWTDSPPGGASTLASLPTKTRKK